MTALPIQAPVAPSVTPVDLPRLRPVSTRSVIDVPTLPAPAAPAPAPVLRVVEEAPEAPVSGVMSAVSNAVAIAVTVASASVFAVGLQYWLSF